MTAPLVISIQSQVVHGHVGNSAAAFPMQAAGLTVAQIPTVLFSNTPHYPTLRGKALPPDLLADLLLGAEERGLPERAAYIVTGYIGSVETAELVAGFIARARDANPGLTYLCDPVMGDTEPGLYVPEPVADVIRDRLLPLADLATPNQFEAGYLTGLPAGNLRDLQKAATALRLAPGATLIATGCVLDDTAPGMLESVILGPGGIARHPAPRLPVALSGTGDLFAALIVAGLAAGQPLGAAVERAQVLTATALASASAAGADEVVLNDPGFRRALLDPQNS